LASDSRISWDKGETWDFGRKLFASSTCPDILGYYGEVLFTSLVLGQIIDLIDAGALFEPDAQPEQKFLAISNVFKQAHATYPLRSPFSILHSSRQNEGMLSTFALFELSWGSIVGWRDRQVPIPSAKSGIAVARGSGAQSVQLSVEQWMKTEVGGTSRAVFSAFCDALDSGIDPASGGAPQLVGIYREGSAKSFGVIHKDRRYLHGLCVDESPWLDGVEWRNELFERCDWETGRKLEGAQRHARPTRL
jgi:hypothetical protein